jgi:hypothetical protein
MPADGLIAALSMLGENVGPFPVKGQLWKSKPFLKESNVASAAFGLLSPHTPVSSFSCGLGIIFAQAGAG